MEHTWISIDEEYPNEYDTVILANGSGYWNGEFWCTHLERGYWGDCMPIEWEVTHWMPIPDLPTLAEEEG